MHMPYANMWSPDERRLLTSCRSLILHKLMSYWGSNAPWIMFEVTVSVMFLLDLEMTCTNMPRLGRRNLWPALSPNETLRWKPAGLCSDSAAARLVWDRGTRNCVISSCVACCDVLVSNGRDMLFVSRSVIRTVMTTILSWPNFRQVKN